MAKIVSQSSVEVEQPQIVFNVRRIKQIAFFMDEALYKFNEIALQSGFQQQVRSNQEGIIDYTIRAIYVYASEPDRILISIDVQTIYKIADFENFLDEKQTLQLPGSLWIKLAETSVSHTRAILALNTAGTIFNDVIIPMIDAKALAKNFFGDIVDS